MIDRILDAGSFLIVYFAAMASLPLWLDIVLTLLLIVGHFKILERLAKYLEKRWNTNG